jgi:pimeloyl-ACP methyl ester carboxylesterase
MDHRFLSYKNSEISYYRIGRGRQVVLCFHGYGEAGKTFSFLEKIAGERYSFFAMDLPFHGQTKWNEGLNFSTADLQKIAEGLLAEHQLKPQTLDQQLCLIGFSLGGRMALSLYQQQAQSIQKVVLLAPDGLKVNFWYWLSTQTWLGNRFFALTMKHPGWFLGFLQLLNKLKLVNASIFKFVNFYISDKEVRDLLYQRWTNLRKIKPDIPVIKSAIQKHRTAFRLVYGKHDRIILSSVGEKFRKGTEAHCTVTVIAAGHQVLHEKHAAEIAAALLH